MNIILGRIEFESVEYEQEGYPYNFFNTSSLSDLSNIPIEWHTPNFRESRDEVRRVFTIPVGNIPEDEIEDYIRELKRSFTRDVNFPLTPSIDYFIPTRDD